jgi:hypothetical protein
MYRPVRSPNMVEATYMFGDTSGSGSSCSISQHDSLYYQHRQLTTSYSNESSNFQELSNLINSIKNTAASGLLTNTELFIFTYNFTTESAFFKGSGKRMISPGTDGLSHGVCQVYPLHPLSHLTLVPLTVKDPHY